MIGNSMVWQGVLIEESLYDLSVLRMLRVINTRVSHLENEEYRGEIHFHNVEVNDARQPLVVETLRCALKPGWYCHLVQNGTMVVIFKGRQFDIRGGDSKRAEEVRRYGLGQGIVAVQMPFEHLIDHPFD